LDSASIPESLLSKDSISLSLMSAPSVPHVLSGLGRQTKNQPKKHKYEATPWLITGPLLLLGKAPRHRGGPTGWRWWRSHCVPWPPWRPRPPWRRCVRAPSPCPSEGLWIRAEWTLTFRGAVSLPPSLPPSPLPPPGLRHRRNPHRSRSPSRSSSLRSSSWARSGEAAQ
jgi:hypothetical protein